MYPGDYCVTVVDEIHQCSTSNCYSIEVVPIDTWITDVHITNNCTGQLGGIDLDVPLDQYNNSGFSYIWSNGETSQDLDNLVAGEYCVTITRWPSNCSLTRCFEIIQINSTPMDITFAYIHPCPYDKNGQIEAIISGGQAPFEYLWNNEETTPIIDNLISGQYCVTVTSNEGCSITECQNLYDYDGYISLAKINSCDNGPSGELSVNSSSIYEQVSYQWSTGDTGSVITNLPLGLYCVTATDTRGCLKAKCEKITERITYSVITNDACIGNLIYELGAATVQNVAGGQAPYQYEWSNGSTLSHATNLEPGSYGVTITDATGCAAFQNV